MDIARPEFKERKRKRQIAVAVVIVVVVALLTIVVYRLRPLTVAPLILALFGLLASYIPRVACHAGRSHGGLAVRVRFDNEGNSPRYSLALRRLRKSPGFTVVAVITRTLEIGADTSRDVAMGQHRPHLA